MFRYIITSLIVIAICTSCSKVGKREKKAYYANNEIGSIAYNVTNETNIVYLLEHDEYIPYIVITNDYNGSTLLLRKNTLRDLYRYNDYNAYYRDSEIDNFLNTGFYHSLNKEVREIIEPVRIEISSKDNFEMHGEIVEEYYTRVFLLSFEELNYGAKSSNTVANEGKNLKFFDLPENRLAQNTNQISCAYWTRSADTGYSSCVFLVGRDGKIGSVNTYDLNGVRPAFCLSGKTPIIYQNNFIEGLSGYVLKTNY